MEFTTTLNVSAKELFTCLNKSIIDDVDAFTGKKITHDDIKQGFTYKKDVNMNKEHPRWATVEIIDYKEPKKYTITYTSNKRKSRITYNVKQTDDYKIELHYKEQINIVKKNEFNKYEFVKAKDPGKVNKLPFFKKLQFRSLVKEIKKQRKL